MIRAVPHAEQTKDASYFTGLWVASLLCEGHQHARKKPRELAHEIMKLYRNEQLKQEIRK